MGRRMHFIRRQHRMDCLHLSLCALFLHLINSTVAYACTMESYYDIASNGGVIELQGMEMYSLTNSPTRSSSGTISCHWTIHVPHGKSVFISASSFHIPESEDGVCGAASLQVFDGSVTPAVLHYKACGDTFEPVFRNWPVVMIRYTQKSPLKGVNYVKPELRLIWQIVDAPPILKRKCPSNEFTCALSGRCVKQTSLCNKIPDCVYGDLLDYSDETTKCYNTKTDYRSSAQTYQTYLTRGDDSSASTLKEVLKRNRFTAITGSIIVLILVAISVSLIAIFCYLSRKSPNTHTHSTINSLNRSQQRDNRSANSFLRYKLMIPGRRRDRRQKAQNTIKLPCSPKVVLDKTSNVANPSYHCEYFEGLPSRQTAGQMTLYSDPPPPFEDSLATEDTSLYGESNIRYLSSYSPAPSTVQSCPADRLVVSLVPTHKKQTGLDNNQISS